MNNMKGKVFVLLICCMMFLSSCSSSSKSIDLNAKISSQMQSEQDESSSSEILSSDIQFSKAQSSDVELSDIQSSELNDSNVTSSETILEESSEIDKVKKVTVSSGTALQQDYIIEYTLSDKELDEFLKVYNDLKLEYVEPYGVDERGITVPGAGSMCPCQIDIDYYDEKESKWLDVPDFASNHKLYKATSGAKEFLDFLSSLDCYKNKDANLYDLWLEQGGK